MRVFVKYDSGYYLEMTADKGDETYIPENKLDMIPDIERYEPKIKQASDSWVNMLGGEIGGDIYTPVSDYPRSYDRFPFGR